jgi:serine/threonine protein kinase
VDVPQFMELLRESRLLDESRLREVAKSARELDCAESIAQHSVAGGYLTRWQAKMLLAGKQGPFFIGNYRISRPIGRGALGTVYKAFHPALERTVALKLLRIPDERSLERFRREIRTIAALDNPHIVHAFDAGQLDRNYFLAMEFVNGWDLARWVHQASPLPVWWCCECIRQAALGLQYAHERGIVHRDIKPSNLLTNQKSLHESPVVKIADFGLVRAGLDIIDRAGLTRVGKTLGTSEYMAPEQAQNSTAVDIRSDIYSLGCTFFELLTARYPFDGSSPVERLMARFRDDASPVCKYRADAPHELEQIVAQMLKREPARRFQTPADVAHALAPFSRSRVDTSARPPAGEHRDSETDDMLVRNSDAAVHRFLDKLTVDLRSRSITTLTCIHNERRVLGLPLVVFAVTIFVVIALLFLIIFFLL